MTIYTSYHETTPYSREFARIWEFNTLQYADDFVCLTTKEMPPFTKGQVLNLNHNLGHIHTLLQNQTKGLSGWGGHMATLAMIAYCSGKDFIFKESDCLWVGDVIGQLYKDIGEAKCVFGKKMISPPEMSCSQATFLVLHDFIPQFVSAYLALPDDIYMLTEDKFVELEKADPTNYARLSIGVDRERPIPESGPFFIQQVTPSEADLLCEKGLISIPQRTIRLILVRYGDILQVAQKMPPTDTLACSKKFSKIATELFPHIELIELDESEVDLGAAIATLQHKYPKHRVVPCQQNGQPEERTLPFRSYQSFQEFYATI